MAFGKFGKYYAGGVNYLPQRFDLVAALREDFETVRRAEGAQHRLQFVSDRAQHFVHTDRTHLRYIVVNLLHNAVKYSTVGTSVILRVELAGAMPRFTVTDAGIGIPEADLNALFSPFYRASNVGERPGTGMGLAIVRKSARFIGAHVAVDSKVAQGTTFTITLGQAPERSIY